ncbi:MAG: glycosyltransferase family 4 protein [Gemmatimonadota bacterium]|nr:glycosyltransferase family 4 protein [Gemmatimonadota bacterium]
MGEHRQPHAERALHVALCGPYPKDDADARTADGVQRCVVMLAHALAALDGVRVSVVARARRSAERREARIDGVDVTWVPDPYPTADYLLGRALLRGRLVGELRRLRPDIVNAHGEPHYIAAALDGGLPSVVTLHGIFADQTIAHGAAPLGHRVAYALTRRWERAYLPRIRHLIAINDEIGRAVMAAARDARVYRVNNPVDQRFLELPAAPAGQGVLFVGQLSRRKGVHLALEAFASVAPVLPGATLRLIGSDENDPAYVAELRARFAPLVDAGRVAFLGGQPPDVVLREMARAATLVLPSEYEASPLVVIEAMAAGRPVVATRVGDLEHLIADGRTGLLVDRGNVDALAWALTRVLTDADFRRSAGALARQTVAERAAPARIARETLAVFEAVLARPPARAVVPPDGAAQLTPRRPRSAPR